MVGRRARGSLPSNGSAATNSDEVIVETSDGDLFLLSRSRLAAESVFFKVLFSGTYKDSKSSRVRLACISSSDFRACLALTAYIKSGFMPDLSAEAAMTLMITASFLQMSSLMEKLISIIVTQVHPSDRLASYREATMQSAELANQLWDRVIKEFRLHLSNRDYETMSENEILTALLDERLDIQCREEELLIDNWIEKNPENRDRMLRLKHEALRRRWKDGFFYAVVRDRVPREVVLAIGGCNCDGPAGTVEVYNPRAQMWVAPKAAVRDIPRAYHGAALCGEKIVILGGICELEHSDQTMLLDLNSGSWNYTDNMLDRRSYVCATTYINSYGTHHVVAMGGFNGQRRLNSAEILDVEMNRWSKLPSMSKERSDAGAAILAGRPTIVGGIDGRNIHNDIEMLDIESQSWLRGSQSMRTVRTGVSAVAYEENSLVVLGGYDGVWRLRSMEFYDYRIGYWYPLPEMTTTRSNFGMEIMNESIYIAGGFDGIRTTNTVERFDMRACKWETLPSMKTPKSALRLIRIADHDIIRSLVEFQSQPVDFEVDLL